MKKMYIHLGMHKTGTTYLQKYIFPYLNDVHFLHQVKLRELVNLDSKRVLVSDEALLGKPFGEEKYDDLSWRNQREINIKNLSTLFPDANLIICFRNHSEFIQSLYAQYVNEGGTLNFENFFDIRNDNGLIKKQDLRYTPLVKKLQKYFNGHLFLYTFEEFLGSKTEVVKEICKFFGENHSVLVPDILKHQRISKVSLHVLRYLNIVNKTYLNKGGFISLNNKYLKEVGLTPRQLCHNILTPLFPEKFKINSSLKKEIENYYRNDWNSLLKLSSMKK